MSNTNRITDSEIDRKKNWQRKMLKILFLKNVVVFEHERLYFIDFGNFSCWPHYMLWLFVALLTFLWRPCPVYPPPQPASLLDQSSSAEYFDWCAAVFKDLEPTGIPVYLFRYFCLHTCSCTCRLPVVTWGLSTLYLHQLTETTSGR